MGGLKVDGTGAFDSADFADVLSEPEQASEESPFAKKPLKSPTGNQVDGDVQELYASPSDDDAKVPIKQRQLNPLVLLIPLVLLLILVFFGDQILGNSEDDPETNSAQVEQGEPVEDNSDEAEETIITGTTTVAPAAAPETTATPETTDAPAPETSSAPQPFSPWDLLGVDSNTQSFANLGGDNGLREIVEGGGEFTVLAPSDAAIAALPPEQISEIASNPATASALINYHIIEGRITPQSLADGDGTVQTFSGLPIAVTVEGDMVILNGQTIVPEEALESEIGNVIVINNVLEPVTVNEVVDLDDIQFLPFNDDLTPEAIAELESVVQFFVDNPDVSAVIEGHTDTDGPPDGNERLSLRRANAVRDFLVSRGVEAARLETVGFGEAQPIIVNGVEDKEASRRIVIVPQ